MPFLLLGATMFFGAMIFFLFMNDGPGKSHVDNLAPYRFVVQKIEGISSPTSLAFNNGRLLLTADYQDPRPGLYIWYRGDDGVGRAGLLHLMVQERVEGIWEWKNGFLVASSMLFQEDSKHWQNQIIHLDAAYQTLERVPINVPNICGDQSRDCGLVAAIPTDEDQLWVITRKERPSLYLVSREEGALEPVRSSRLYFRGRDPEISEVKQIGDHLYFLIKNRWALARAAVSQVKTYPRRLDLEPVFDFSHLKKKYSAGPLFMQAGGLAEGFVFDGKGNLHIVLANQGYAFENAPREIRDSEPILLTFTTAEKPSGTVEKQE